MSQYTYFATILDSSNKHFVERVEHQINNFILYDRGGSALKKNAPGKYMETDIFYCPKEEGSYDNINIDHFFKSLCLNWVRRYAIGYTCPLDDHWCDILDAELGVTRFSRRKLLNFGSEYLSTKLKNNFPCLNEFLISLQQIQAGWVTTPVLEDNRWEFQPIYFNKNIDF